MKTPRLICLVLAVGYAATLTPTAMGDGPRKNPKLSTELADLAQAIPQRNAPLAPGEKVAPPKGFSVDKLPESVRDAVRTGMMRINENAEVQVYIEITGTVFGSHLTQLSSLGATPQRIVLPKPNTVEALLPITMINQAAMLPFVRYIRLPDYGSTDQSRGSAYTTRESLGRSQGAGATARPSSAVLARQGHGISADEASQLEESLTRDANDLAARAQLLGYYFGMGGRRLSPEVARQARLRHILWLVQNRAESELAALSEASIDPTGHPLADQEGYEKVKAAWLEQAEKHKDNAAVLGNATRFFKLSDKAIAARLLKRAQAVDPSNREWSAGLGFVYTAGIVGLTLMNQNRFPIAADPDEARGSFAQQAREDLAKSQDAAVVGTAGYYLNFWGSILSASGKAPADFLDLAEQLLSKAQALEPSNAQWRENLARLYDSRARMATSPEQRAALARKRLEILEKGPDTIKLGLSTLTDLARAAFDAGEFEKAETYAHRLLEVASQNRSDFYYGAALHHGNLILGRLALRAGDVQKAKSSLLAAARTPAGGPQLSSFGPNMSLAKELLERGEKQAVLEYLELCKSFWTYPGNPLDRWIETIKSGGTPNFGANLIY